jgi:AraC-like DNA-binding protein
MDALSDVLRITQLTGGVFLHAEFTAPWCLTARMTPELCAPFLGPASHLMPFHYVLEGDLDVAVDGAAPLRLHAGEIVLFPRNDVHLMGSDLKLAPVRAIDIIVPSPGGGLNSIRHGQGGARTRMICGYLGCDSRPGNPVITALPPAFKFTVADAASAEWIRSNFEYAASAIASGRMGSDTVLAKVSELMFVEAVRGYVEAMPPGQRGWLAGLGDPTVARALALLHGAVDRDWNVEALAREVGSSRSVLAERFVRTIGMAPMHYLTHWRMQLAARELKGSYASLARVAERIGYQSEAAFSRAFKKEFGAAPATWRRGDSVNP